MKLDLLRSKLAYTITIICYVTDTFLRVRGESRACSVVISKCKVCGMLPKTSGIVFFNSRVGTPRLSYN